MSAQKGHTRCNWAALLGDGMDFDELNELASGADFERCACGLMLYTKFYIRQLPPSTALFLNTALLNKSTTSFGNLPTVFCLHLDA